MASSTRPPTLYDAEGSPIPPTVGMLLGEVSRRAMSAWIHSWLASKNLDAVHCREQSGRAEYCWVCSKRNGPQSCDFKVRVKSKHNSWMVVEVTKHVDLCTSTRRVTQNNIADTISPQLYQKDGVVVGPTAPVIKAYEKDQNGIEVTAKPKNVQDMVNTKSALRKVQRAKVIAVDKVKEDFAGGFEYLESYLKELVEQNEFTISALERNPEGQLHR